MKNIILFLLLLLPAICLAQEGKVCEIKFVNGKVDKYYIFEVSETQVWAALYKDYISSYNRYSLREVFKKDEIASIICDGSVYYDVVKEKENLDLLKNKLGEENYNYLTYLEKKRDPAAAGLFSFLLIGGGQFYNNQPDKGVIMFLGQIVVVTFVVRGDIPWYSVFPLPVISLVDAISSASNINAELRQKYDIKLSYRNNTAYFIFSKSF